MGSLLGRLLESMGDLEVRAVRAVPTSLANTSVRWKNLQLCACIKSTLWTSVCLDMTVRCKSTSTWAGDRRSGQISTTSSSCCSFKNSFGENLNKLLFVLPVIVVQNTFR